MMIEALKEIKERGIKNVVSEQIELIKELGVMGYIKAKTEEIRGHAATRAFDVRKLIFGRETIGREISNASTEKEIESEIDKLYPSDKEIKIPAPGEDVKSQTVDSFKMGM